MKICPTEQGYALYKEKEPIGRCELTPAGDGARLHSLWVAPAWRRHGYGSYFLKELLRLHRGYDREAATLFTAPMPARPEELAFWERFGFVPQGAQLVRRRRPDLTAVRLVQDFLAARVGEGAFCIDATCGNGGDTLFLARLVGESGRVLGMDIQPQAIASTQRRLDEAGIPAGRVHLVCDSHAKLLQYAPPESADAVLFNFGWLPGAAHEVFSTAESSLPALEAALRLLRPGGVLSALLYSGKTIGSGEKQAVLDWLEHLPLTEYTVLVCRFANWADTAPLPCVVLKKGG